MFFLPSNKPKVSDFKLTSSSDQRPLAFRLRVLDKDGTVRVEPVDGFVPNTRYTFQYLPAHEKWDYPDRTSVTIDDVSIDTAGVYAIDMAPQPEVRMIVVPGSPACTEPALAITQPFSYRLPAALAPYRGQLEYGTRIRSEPLRVTNKNTPQINGWPFGLSSYYTSIFWPDRRTIDNHYTGADDAIVAPCNGDRMGGNLVGSVAFPEVDDKTYRIPAIHVDLGRNRLGKCRPLDALSRTIKVYGEKQGLMAMCARTFTFDPAPSRSNETELTAQWERAFGLPNDLSQTCALVTLAYAVITREYLPDQKAMSRLGAALEEGLRISEGIWLLDQKPIEEDLVYRQTIDGLDYLARKLPEDLHPTLPALLEPLLPRLTAHLAEPRPYRVDLVAALIVRAGSLPAKVRAKLFSIAQGRAAGSSQARAILARLQER